MFDYDFIIYYVHRWLYSSWKDMNNIMMFLMLTTLASQTMNKKYVKYPKSSINKYNVL